MSVHSMDNSVCKIRHNNADFQWLCWKSETCFETVNVLLIHCNSCVDSQKSCKLPRCWLWQQLDQVGTEYHMINTIPRAVIGLIVWKKNRTYFQVSYPLCSTENSQTHMNPSFSPPCTSSCSGADNAVCRWSTQGQLIIVSFHKKCESVFACCFLTNENGF